MTLLQQAQSTESLIAQFFRDSEAHWQSERRYYTLPNGETKEGLSFLTVKFLEQGSTELLHLAELHQLSDPLVITCGSLVTWKSLNPTSGKLVSKGSTLFGADGTNLYRDRGFAILKPVTAKYCLPNPNTLCLRTEYDGNVFEEEIKHIGQQYRTRQSIVSRAGEQKMIGQYLETRIQETA